MLKDTRDQLAGILARLREAFPEDYLSVRVTLELSQFQDRETTEETKASAWISDSLGKKGRFVDAKDPAGIVDAVQAEVEKARTRAAARKERRKKKKGEK
jgi:hypothetical protein